MASIFQNGAFSLGFDMQPTASNIWTQSNGSSTTYTSNTPYSFGYACQFNNSNTINGIFLNTNLSTLISSYAVYFPSLPGSNMPYAGWYDMTGGGTQLNLRLNSAGTFQFFLGSGSSTAIGSPASTSIIAARWYYIETMTTIGSGGTGSVTLRINNATVISASSVTTQSTGNAWTNAFQFIVGSSGGPAFWVDDWIMLDTTGTSPLNTFLGPVQVRGDKASANSAHSRNQFTPTSPTGSNYQNVDNVPLNAAQYNSDATVGDYDMFQFPSLPASVSTVFFLNEWAACSLDSAGSRQVALDIYSNGTDSLGTSFTPPPVGSPGYSNMVQTTDPHTGAAWMPANASAAELGMKVTA